MPGCSSERLKRKVKKKNKDFLVATMEPRQKRSIIQTEGLCIMYIQCLQSLLAGYYLRLERQQSARKRTESNSLEDEAWRLLYIVPSVVLCKVTPESKKKSRRCRWLSFIDRRKVLNVNGWKKNKQKKKFYRKRHAQPTRFRWYFFSHIFSSYRPTFTLQRGNENK